MTLREEVIMNLEQIPENKLSVLLHFMHFLSECPITLGMPEKTKGRPRDLLGILKGKVWVSDDFSDKLEYVSQDELKILEDMRAKKKAAAQKATA